MNIENIFARILLYPMVVGLDPLPEGGQSTTITVETKRGIEERERK